jgi:hypothetical protein
MYRCQNWVSKLSRTFATVCIYTPRHGRLLVAYNVTENRRSLFYDTRKGTDGSCPVSTFPTLLVKVNISLLYILISTLFCYMFFVTFKHIEWDSFIILTE